MSTNSHLRVQVHKQAAILVLKTSNPSLSHCHWGSALISDRNLAKKKRIKKNLKNGRKPQHPGFPRGPPPWY